MEVEKINTALVKALEQALSYVMSFKTEHSEAKQRRVRIEAQCEAALARGKENNS